MVPKINIKKANTEAESDVNKVLRFLLSDKKILINKEGEIRVPLNYDKQKLLDEYLLICPHCNTGDLKIIEYEPARFKIRCDNCLDEWVADYAKQ